jgi:hypothetical protein
MGCLSVRCLQKLDRWPGKISRTAKIGPILAVSFTLMIFLAEMAAITLCDYAIMLVLTIYSGATQIGQFMSVSHHH